MKNRLRATMVLALGLAGYMGYVINSNDYCNYILEEDGAKEVYVDATEWIDPTVKRIRALSKKDGRSKVKIVWHHSATSESLTAKQICNITNDRFGLGCSYAMSVHSNGKVIQMNDFSEHSPSVGGMNSYVISIVFVGNYQEHELPLIMVKRACQIKTAFELFESDNEDFEIEGYYLHRDLKATLCPGDKAVIQLEEYGIVDSNQVL
jgi:hypothetical protein